MEPSKIQKETLCLTLTLGDTQVSLVEYHTFKGSLEDESVRKFVTNELIRKLVSDLRQKDYLA